VFIRGTNTKQLEVPKIKNNNNNNNLCMLFKNKCFHLTLNYETGDAGRAQQLR
jgi:hypothetical protein